MNKICTKCKIEKPILFFSKDKSKKDGYYTSCKECSRKKDHKSFIKHKDKRLKSSREWHHLNKEVQNKKRKDRYYKNYVKKGRPKHDRIAYQKQYYLKNKERKIKAVVQRAKERRKTDLNFKISLNLRGRLNKAIKNKYKKTSAVADLGCSIDFFIKHIESLFQPGMSWENWGKGSNKWHIDHIVPLSKVDLTNPEEAKKVTHYTNLQPLWELDNIKKGSKL